MWFQLQELQDFRGKTPTVGRDWLGLGRRMNTGWKEGERSEMEGRGCLLSLWGSASGLEKLGPWGFATEQESLQD